MTIFNRSENSTEAKYVHDQDLEFRIIARRDHLMGLWAGDLLGLKGNELALYTGTVITADLAEPGDEDVVRKIVSDFSAAHIDQSEHDIRAKIEHLQAVAQREIVTGE